MNRPLAQSYQTVDPCRQYPHRQQRSTGDPAPEAAIMLQSDQIEELLCLISALDRDALTQQFQNYRGRFPLDFSPEFLHTAPLERLQHIFFAICLQNQHLPQACQAA
ncbi:MAG TPA: hypothetical protein VFE58_04035 [Tepidisphaeraceae bacterium]|nr:hypothetical protein [Tepidisphaeraceae bacterium]